MTDLTKYYGRELMYIRTKLQHGKLESTAEVQEVYNPRDFNCNVAPTTGCDLVIGNHSADSNHIYEIGGVKEKNLAFEFSRFDQMTLFNYCEIETAKNLIALHKSMMLKALAEYIDDERKKIDEAEELLKELNNE